MCKVNGGKISHKKLEESGACTVSVAFCCAQLRNRAAVPELRTMLRPGAGFAGVPSAGAASGLGPG